MNPNLNGSNPSKQAGVLQVFNLLDRQRGFTLLEVMIVMVIMGVVSAIAIPAFSDWRERQAVTSGTQALMAHLKQARIMAVAQNRTITIKICNGTFSDADGAVNAWVFDANSPSSKCDPCPANYLGLNPSPPCRENRYDFSQFSKQLTVSKNGSATTMKFLSRGTVNSKATFTIATPNHSKQLTVNAIGRAYLK